MKNRFRRHVPATLIVVCALTAPAAQAAPASVQLRIEGRNTTIYEGPVTTDGKVVRPEPGEDHTCDGTNNGANPQPGPTPVSALDDGQPLGGYTWAGTWFPSFADYQVERIGPDAITSSEFWGQLVNFKFSQVGGCQEIVKGGDEVLWAFDAFSKAHAAKLTGPTAATTGRPFAVTVTDGANGAALAGSSVGGAVTGADGRATLRFDQPGIYRLKASRADSVRSNALSVCADPAGAAPCTSTDKSAPKLRLLLSGNTLATRERQLAHGAVRVAGRRRGRQRGDRLLGRRGRADRCGRELQRGRLPPVHRAHAAHARALPRRPGQLVPLPRDGVRSSHQQGGARERRDLDPGRRP